MIRCAPKAFLAVGGQPLYKTEQGAIFLPCEGKFFPKGQRFASKNTSGSNVQSTSCPSEAPGGWSIFRLCDDECPSGTLLISFVFLRFSLGLEAGKQPLAPSYRARKQIASADDSCDGGQPGWPTSPAWLPMVVDQAPTVQSRQLVDVDAIAGPIAASKVEVAIAERDVHIAGQQALALSVVENGKSPEPTLRCYGLRLAGLFALDFPVLTMAFVAVAKVSPIAPLDRRSRCRSFSSLAHICWVACCAQRRTSSRLGASI